VVLVIAFLLPTVGSQVEDIAASASKGLTTIQDRIADSDLAITQDQVDTIVKSAQDRLTSSSSAIAAGVLVGVGAVTNGLINLVLALVLTFFFLKDGRRFLPWLRGLSGEKAGGHLTTVAAQAWEALATFVRTQALVGLIDGVLIGAGLLIVGVPLALPLAVLTFFAAFAPIVGAITVGALAVLVALVSNGWVSALIAAGIVLLVQQLEGNVLLPYLQGKSLSLHAGVVLLSIVLGSTLFGVAGAFLSVPVVAVLAVVLRYLNLQVSHATTTPKS
jgi:predicted PurR-regulated permease PerM